MVNVFSFFILGLSFIFSLGYGTIFINREISKARSLFKTLPIFLLAIYALFATPQFLWLAFALFFCALGDFFLSLDKNKFFISGLSAFLIGHILYVLFFNFELGIEPTSYLSVLGVAIYAISFGGYLVTKTTKYRIPIIGYVLILCAMVIFATFLPPQYIFVKLGALVFVISDSLLAIRMFIIKEKRSKEILSIAVWCTYITAQFLIVLKLTL